MSRVKREASPSDTRMLWNGWTGRDSGARLGDRDSGMPADDLLYIHKNGKGSIVGILQMKEKKSLVFVMGGRSSRSHEAISRKKKRGLMMATRDDRSPTWVSVKFEYVLVVAPSTQLKRTMI